MKNYLPFLALLFVAFIYSKGNCAQGIKNLEENYGFKKYKLNSKFVMGYGVKHKDDDGADRIVIDYAREFIGEIPVKTIELFYVNDTLSKIIVNVLPDYYVKLKEACENSFGPPTQNISFNDKMQIDSSVSVNYFKDNYAWKAKNFKLEYYYLYPRTKSGAYGNKTLQLIYVMNNYSDRLKRMKRTSGASKSF